MTLQKQNVSKGLSLEIIKDIYIYTFSTIYSLLLYTLYFFLPKSQFSYELMYEGKHP